MSGETVEDTLNTFLKGQYMGIRAYEHLIEKVTDPNIKKVFQNIQQEHKFHAQRVAERIQNLGGTPVDDEGMMGSIQGFISQMRLPETTNGLLETALKGEDYYGIQISEEIVKGDLDPESRKLIEEILDRDREHVKMLNGLV